MPLRLAGTFFACLLISACTSEPTFLRSSTSRTLECQSDTTTSLTLRTSDQGKMLEFSDPALNSNSLQFVRGFFAEDYYRGDGIEAWVDPEIRIKFADGRRIGPCN
jgi:hypothetical protein